MRHAGNLGFLGVVAERNRGFGKNLGGGHHALAANPDDEDIAGRAHTAQPPLFTSLIGDTGT